MLQFVCVNVYAGVFMHICMLPILTHRIDCVMNDYSKGTVPATLATVVSAHLLSRHRVTFSARVDSYSYSLLELAS